VRRVIRNKRPSAPGASKRQSTFSSSRIATKQDTFAVEAYTRGVQRSEKHCIEGGQNQRFQQVMAKPHRTQTLI
jgi:hypothetical protein